ncbi:MAG: DUF3592 domain-containing protein [Spirochaetota bacterium]
MAFKKHIVLFFLIFGLVVTLAGIKMINEAKESLSWPHTEGVIVTSHMDKRYVKGQGYQHFANITYEFEVGGEKYRGSQISFKNLDIPDEELLRLYPLGKKVKVYYDPDDPSYSLLEPGISIQTYTALFIGIVLLVVAISTAIFYKPKKATS